MPALNFTAAQTAFLHEQTDPLFRETVRDYWIKGPRRLSGLAQQKALCAQRVMLVVPPADMVMKVKSLVGEVALIESVHALILASLADQQSHSLGTLWEGLQADPHRVASILRGR